MTAFIIFLFIAVCKAKNCLTSIKERVFQKNKRILSGGRGEKEMSEFDDFEGGYARQAQTYEEKDYTLVFCRRINEETGKKQLLLGMKKRGFGQGKWNGFGGKLEEGETIHQCAIREMIEESGVTCNDVVRVGYLVFKLLDVHKMMRVHVFESTQFSGEPTESDEMRPQWYDEDSLPFQKMWPDDAHWMPYFLSGKSFIGRFVYEDEDTIEDFDIRENKFGV